MITPEEKNISGQINGDPAEVEYKVTPLPAMQGMRMAVKLAKTFGGGIGKAAIDAAGSKNDEAGLMNMDVGQIIDGILGNLDEDETPKLISELLKGTQRNGVYLTNEVIDKVYTQNFGELFKALQFALEVNFGGFIGALAQASSNTGNTPAASAAAKA